MSSTLLQTLLPGNSFYTEQYVSDTVNLTKSLIIVNHKEALFYNENLEINYPAHAIDKANKSTWRYYKHLSGQVHPVDIPIKLISLDNGMEITFSKETMDLHRITRDELLSYGLYYSELINKYPEQELYIRSVLTLSTRRHEEDITLLPNLTILSYNKALVEDNEHDLIDELQIRLDNYKNIWMIQFYADSDSLFMAMQIVILYQWLLTSLFAIRLANAKTMKAHTYHLINYLSSHHYLDTYYPQLTKKQALFLYRNLKYLNNHAGRTDNFNTLIDRLFTDRNIAVVNYINHQLNEVDGENRMNYIFNQDLLNDAPLIYSKKDFSLEDMRDKELPLARDNPTEYKFNLERVNHDLKNTLHNKLTTKDLESVIVDNTDNVRWKLIPTIIDYWAYLLKTERISFLVKVLDPVTNQELKLNTLDLFKLFTLVTFKSNNIELNSFPDYQIKRVYKESLPNNEELFNVSLSHKFEYTTLLNTYRMLIPIYRPTITSYQFYTELNKIYQLNIGLWLLLSNLSDSRDRGHFENYIDAFHQTTMYTFDNESVFDYLKRIGLEQFNTYTEDSLNSLSYQILNNLFDGQLGFLNYQKNVQKAMVEIFKKFNSYTVQFIENYVSSDPVLAGPRELRYHVSGNKHVKLYLYNAYQLNVDTIYKIKKQEELLFNFKINSELKQSSKVFINSPFNSNANVKLNQTVQVLFNSQIVTNLGQTDWTIQPSSQEDLRFLAFN